MVKTHARIGARMASWGGEIENFLKSVRDFLFSHAAKIDIKDAHGPRDLGAPVKLAF